MPPIPSPNQPQTIPHHFKTKTIHPVLLHPHCNITDKHLTHLPFALPVIGVHPQNTYTPYPLLCSERSCPQLLYSLLICTFWETFWAYSLANGDFFLTLCSLPVRQNPNPPIHPHRTRFHNLPTSKSKTSSSTYPKSANSHRSSRKRNCASLVGNYPKTRPNPPCHLHLYGGIQHGFCPDHRSVPSRFSRALPHS